MAKKLDSRAQILKELDEPELLMLKKFATLKKPKTKRKKPPSGRGAAGRRAASSRLDSVVQQTKAAFGMGAEGTTSAQDREAVASGDLGALTDRGDPDSIREAVEAAKLAAEEHPGQLAITFKSGVTCLYSTSGTGDYIQFMAAGSKGKWVHARGWGPKGKPSYSRISPDPKKIIANGSVSSSWATHAYLMED